MLHTTQLDVFHSVALAVRYVYAIERVERGPGTGLGEKLLFEEDVRTM